MRQAQRRPCGLEARFEHPWEFARLNRSYLKAKIGGIVAVGLATLETPQA